jgi:hypothetical protein
MYTSIKDTHIFNCRTTTYKVYNRFDNNIYNTLYTHTTQTLYHNMDLFFSKCFPCKKTLSGACRSGDLREFNMFRDSPYRDFITEDYDKKFPLLCAIKSGNISIVEKIMLKGDICSFSTIFGWTVVHEAVVSGSFEMLLFLLKFGKCKTYVKTSDGNTPMHIAISEKRSDMVEILSEYTPSKMMSIKNNEGMTPLVLAVFMENPEMVDTIHVSGGSLFRERYNGHSVYILAFMRGISNDLRTKAPWIHPISGLPISSPVDIIY